MLSNVLAVLAIFAATAAAQNPSPCILTCVTQALASGGCSSVYVSLSCQRLGSS
ncbi:hypothetical protein BV25DRAFT_1826064 [Artomyces pyxidatus]|uniref:Uncharacterized protein n=1 Tax=Artomyces pyxidatus TaxID=48021 RepID=A0ACB8T037_9AGAM|nr:hypothetical protein BV25DRAFT_1826064 [Artomyces pyxidatus]